MAVAHKPGLSGYAEIVTYKKRRKPTCELRIPSRRLLGYFTDNMMSPRTLGQMFMMSQARIRN